MSIQYNSADFPPISPFALRAYYAQIDRYSPHNTFDSHIHPHCEVYFNLSGDVSFMVENHIYPICPGSIILTRPYEYHHCIYHSDAPHRHFCFWFSSEGNEHLLKPFFNRAAGEQNLLIPDDETMEQLTELCTSMLEPTDEANRYYQFFRFLHLLEKSSVTQPERRYPTDVTAALNYISSHLAEPVTVEDLARLTFVSVNTLERHFATYLNMSPSVYIKKKRLANAAKLLASGCSVAEASEQSGIPDYSYFISIFRRNFGITPLQYRKKHAGK